MGAQDDLSESKIKKSKITHVLNATKDLEKPKIIQKENFLRIPVLDSQCETILTFLEESFSEMHFLKSVGGNAETQFILYKRGYIT